MKYTRSVLLFFFTIQLLQAAAQGNQDSAKLANTLKELLQICKKVDFTDPKVQQLGTFYKAAPYIAYMGNDKSRKWKAIADYTNAGEKKQVDEICYRINSTVNQDSAYTFIKYLSKKESEGIWHVIIVSYKKKGTMKRAAFAFLRIGKNFALGDID